jgi:antitoxin component of MazEF toxin-antitoxin module
MYVQYRNGEVMITKTSARNIGGTMYVRIPPHLIEHLGVKEGDDTVSLEDKSGPKGKFATLWSNEK